MILSSELLNIIFVSRHATLRIQFFARPAIINEIPLAFPMNRIESWYLALAANKWLVMTDTTFATTTVIWLWISTTISAALCITDRNGIELFVNSETSDRSFAAIRSFFECSKIYLTVCKIHQTFFFNTRWYISRLIVHKRKNYKKFRV